MNMYAKLMPPDPFRQTDPRLTDEDPPEPPGLTWPDAFSVLVKVRDTLAWIMARFWSPAAFGRLDCIMRSQRSELLVWLRPLETILRRMFLIEAHALAPNLPQPAPRAASRAASPASPTTPEATDEPETGTAAFSTRATAASRADGSELVHSPCFAWRRRLKDEDDVAARPLALRVEALLRAVLDPMKHIRRLAHQIRRQGAPAFAPKLAPEACEPPSLRRALALVTDTAMPLFSLRPDPPGADSS